MEDRKKTPFFKSYAVALSLILLLILSCSPEDSSTGPSLPLDPTQVAKPISCTVNRLEIRIDPRMELLGIARNLESYQPYEGSKTSLFWDVRNYFSPHKEHPAGVMARRCTDTRGDLYSAVALLLCYDQPPGLERVYTLSAAYLGSPDSNDNLITALRDFYLDSNFITFYESHRAEYQERVNNNAARFGGERDIVGFLEEYFGEQKERYIGIYSSHWGGGESVVIRHDGKLDCYAVFSNEYVLLHEFAHCFVNAVTEDFAEEVQAYSQLYVRTYYDTWTSCVNEHLIRAFTSRAYAILDGEERGLQKLGGEEREGFQYVRPIYELFKEYEAHRDIYPDFRSFYPRILDLFAELLSERQ
ncbi:MAG: DUF4932 domain-containing protein [Candidatus Latescibacteria bacterium]|nr:DUF4932 domain-containing protein [Candidatus Latescibacterota bacterium]